MWKNSVLTGPGQTAVTYICLSLSSRPSALEKLSTYDFVAEYTANLGCGKKAALEAKLIIDFSLPYKELQAG